MLNEIRKEETTMEMKNGIVYSDSDEGFDEPKTVFFGRRLWVKQPDGSWIDWDRLQNQ